MNADYTELSIQSNDLSEAICALSLRLQSVKGHRSVFRNRTEARPLADGVLQRLADADARAAAAESPAPVFDHGVA